MRAVVGFWPSMGGQASAGLLGEFMSESLVLWLMREAGRAIVQADEDGARAQGAKTDWVWLARAAEEHRMRLLNRLLQKDRIAQAMIGARGGAP